MGFSDQIKQFSNRVNTEMDQVVKATEERAKKRLAEVLGDDIKLVKSAVLDADVGKFSSVDAPPAVIEKIRTAGLLKP